MTRNVPPTPNPDRCPTCRKPTVHEHRPFCSRRCADLDLAGWLGGKFVIPGSTLETADDSLSESDLPHSGMSALRPANDDGSER